MVDFSQFMESVPFVFIFLLVISAIAGFYTIIYHFKLYNYLKRHNYKRWKEQVLFEKGSLLPVDIMNPFRTLRYTWNDLDCQDKNIKIYKKRINVGAKITLSFLSITIILIFVIIFIGIKGT